MGVHDANMDAIRDELGIEDDEPLFILRGQDHFIVPAVARYRNLVAQTEGDARPSEEWFARLDGDVQRIAEWQRANPDRIKIPD